MAGPPSQPLSSLIYRSAPYRRWLRRRPASEISTPPALPVIGDAAAGQAVVDGSFVFHGRRVPFGRMPWSVLPPGERLAAALHGFVFLADLEALGGDAARTRARTLVLDWIEIHRAWTAVAWAPPVLARRLINWLAASDFLLSGAGPAARAGILAAASAQARHLRRVASRSADTPAALPVAVALAAAALSLGIGDPDRSMTALQRALARQLHRDGGVRQRSPSAQLAALCDLIGVRAAFEAAGRSRFPLLGEGIERMAAWLRLMRHGDGALSVFNGGKEEDRRAVDLVLATVLAAAGSGGGTPVSAPGTGYERLAAGRTCLIVDCGGPPPAAWSAAAHAAPLAFELSCGRQRLIVNCGCFAGDDERWQRALRSTAAHSSVAVDDADAVTIGADGRLDPRRLKVSGVAARGRRRRSGWRPATTAIAAPRASFTAGGSTSAPMAATSAARIRWRARAASGSRCASTCTRTSRRRGTGRACA